MPGGFTIGDCSWVSALDTERCARDVETGDYIAVRCKGLLNEAFPRRRRGVAGQPNTCVGQEIVVSAKIVDPVASGE